jgi:uncharacterized BrkB/YihY/UPF0761 family membrane protein
VAERALARAGRLPAAAWNRTWATFDRAVARLDALQQRHAVSALPVAVLRKYSDDQAGRLTGQISYSAFLTVFPMFLVLFTVVGIVLAGNAKLQNDVITSALRQFPVIGADIQNNVHQLSTSFTAGLVIGLLWLTYGAMRLSRASQTMMAEVWGIGRDDLPDLLHWLPRAVAFLVVLGVGFLAGGALAGVGSFGHLGLGLAVAGVVAMAAVNIVMYRLAFGALVHLPRHLRRLWPGAIFGGVGWTVLQVVGAALVNHQLRHLANLYGTFATVLGLVWWMALGALITVYAAEFNVVLTRHLWPRSFRQVRERA